MESDSKMATQLALGPHRIGSIEDCMDASIQELEKDCIKKSKERLITATSNSCDYMRTNRKIRNQKCEEKQLYGYFKRQTGEIPHEKIQTMAMKGKLQKRN